jgi:hypothetical protein
MAVTGCEAARLAAVYARVLAMVAPPLTSGHQFLI